MREKSLHLGGNDLLTSSHNSRFVLEIYEKTDIGRVETHPVLPLVLDLLKTRLNASVVLV